MTTWPLEKRNKVEDSKIADPVKKYAEMEDETVKNVATKVRHNCPCAAHRLTSADG